MSEKLVRSVLFIHNTVSEGIYQIRHYENGIILFTYWENDYFWSNPGGIAFSFNTEETTIKGEVINMFSYFMLKEYLDTFEKHMMEAISGKFFELTEVKR